MTLKSTNIGLGPQIADGATGNSSVFRTEGCTSGAVGVTSSHAGTLSVQRFVDEGGVTSLSTPLTVAVVANTPIAVGWADGLPCGSIVVSFINSAGAAANLTNISVNLAP